MIFDAIVRITAKTKPIATTSSNTGIKCPSFLNLRLLILHYPPKPMNASDRRAAVVMVIELPGKVPEYRHTIVASHSGEDNHCQQGIPRLRRKSN